MDLKIFRPQEKAAIDEAIMRVLAHGHYVLGPELTELEQKLSSYVGVKHCVLTSNGTSALGAALMAVGMKPGDEIITSPFSFFASAEVIAILGAKPVFVDIDPLTYNLDCSLLEQAITDKTRAIMPVSLFGQPAEMREINTIAARYHLPVIEDGAQSFGATHHGRKSGALSSIGCTSFFPSKPLGCFGDGGASFTDDDHLATLLRSIVNHGQQERYLHARLGFNGRLDSIQAAVLLEKLKYFDRDVEMRQKLANFYSDQLGGRFTLPRVLAHNTSNYAQYTIQVDQRDRVRALLSKKGIPTAVHYPLGLHQQPAIKQLGYQYPSYPICEQACARVLSLPFYPHMPFADAKRVADALHEVCFAAV